MLRLSVAALLLANAGYYAWSHQWLAGLGLAPATQAEPERLQRQIAPEALRVVPAPGGAQLPGTEAAPTGPGAPAAPPAGNQASRGAATSAAASDTDPGAAAAADGAAPAPAAPAAPASGAAALPVASSAAAAARGECLQAGPLDAAEADTWRRAAGVLPQGSWSLEGSTVAGRWMVYMGRFADADALARKRAELRARNVPFDRPASATLEPGLSLGRFASEEAAERALATLAAQHGVRSARVVQERAESTSYTLRLPLVDAQLRAQLGTLRPALAGKPLRPCF